MSQHQPHPRLRYSYRLQRPDGSEASGTCSLEAAAAPGDCIRIATRQVCCTARIVAIEADSRLLLEPVTAPRNPGNAAQRLLGEQGNLSGAMAALFCI